MSEFNNAVAKLEINEYYSKDCFEQTTNKSIQENNADIVSKMLVDDIINQSIEELEEEGTEKNNLLSVTELQTVALQKHQ